MPLMQGGGAAVYGSAPACALFPTALKTFGIGAERIIFVDLKREKDTALERWKKH